MGEALFNAYPAAEVKVTQGLTDAIPQGNNNEVSRIAFAGAFTAVRPAHA